MNVFDKFLRSVAPRLALRRERARAALRIYDAAEPGRRANAWRGRGLSQNSEAQRAIGPLRDRSRDYARNSAWGPRILDVLSGYVIGSGWRPVPRTGSDRLDSKVVKLWEEWNKEADVEGVLSFEAQQSLAFRSAVESGDVVLRFVDQKRGRGRGSKIPVKVQVLESDLIDHSRDGAYAENSGAGNGTVRSRLGIGLGEFDYRTGMWLYPYHPGDVVVPNVNGTTSKFFGRDEIAHMFRMLRPGQVRGISWFAPMLTTGRDLADFLDALIVKARVEACFTGFVTNAMPEEYDAPFEDNQQGLTSTDNPNALITTMEPGTLRELRYGQDIKFAQATTTSQVDPMLKYPLMAMAAAVGVTYEQLSGDLSGSNYISLRAGKLDFRRLVEQTQNTMILPMMMHPVWDRFIDRAIIAGELSEREKGYPVDWVTPAWESVNPKFDNDAEERAVRSGRQSPQEFVESFGRDWRKNQDDAKEFFERADKLGLVYDIDTRRVSRGGQMHPPQQGGVTPPESPEMELPTDESGNIIENEDVIDAFEDQQLAANDRVLPFPLPLKVRPKARKRAVRKRKKNNSGDTGDDGNGNEGGDGVAPAAAQRHIPTSRAFGDFDEDEHPRDEGGKFTDKGDDDGSSSEGSGGSSGSSVPKGSGGGAQASDVQGAKGSDDSSVHEGLQRFPRSGGERVGGGGRINNANSVAHYAPSDAEREEIESGGDTPLEFHELATGQGEKFRAAILEAKSKDKYGAAVTAYDAADYDDLRTFVTDDGTVGFALKEDDIISVFKNPDSTAKGAIKSVMPLAIEQGGRRLDCFDTQLPRLYADTDFRPVARLAFNDEYKPEGWDYKTFERWNDGRPDVVFMVHDKVGSGFYKPGSGKVVSTYEEGIKAQQDALSSKTPASDAIREHPSLSDVTADATATVKGFLTPDGTVLSKPSGDQGASHSDFADDVGVSLDAVMSEGTQRIYFFPKGALGAQSASALMIDMAVKPTAAQMKALNKIVNENTIDSIAVDGATGSYRSDDVVTPSVLRKAINEVFKGERQLADDIMTRIEWNEEDHPREDDGKFTESGGGGGGGGESETAATTTTTTPPAGAGSNTSSVAQSGESSQPALDPAVVDVGGDDWNKSIATRLEREYATSKQKIEELAERSVGKSVFENSSDDEDSSVYVPDEWDALTTDHQTQAEDAYKSSTFDDFLQSEHDNWYSEYAEDEARGKVAEDFTDGTETDWAMSAIEEWRTDWEDANAPRKIPFTNEQILEALTVEHEVGDGSYKIDNRTDVDLDDAKLGLPKGFDESEPSLPGVAPPEPGLADLEQRDSLLNEVEEAFKAKAEQVRDRLDPPEYLADNVAEYQSDSWSQMSSSEKFEWIKNHTKILEEIGEQISGGGEDVTVVIPDKFDPLQEEGGTDYRDTQTLARYMSRERAAEVIKERGLAAENVNVREIVASMDNALWRDWKGASTTENGKLLQVAASDELGGRFLETTAEFIDRNKMIEYANEHYAKIGGYNGVKAYVRAKWEVTQFLLDKADVDTLQVYRGLQHDEARATRVEPVKAPDNDEYKYLPDAHIDRNGLMSTTLNPGVANAWKVDRVVLRLDVPRTAVLSVPAYGINVHSEREVVVAGTAWRGWDVWKDTAPDFDEVPLKKAA